MHNHKEGWNFFAVKQLDLSVKVRTPFKNKEGFDLYFACRIKISGFMFVCPRNSIVEPQQTQFNSRYNEL